MNFYLFDYRLMKIINRNNTSFMAFVLRFILLGVSIHLHPNFDRGRIESGPEKIMYLDLNIYQKNPI